MAMDKGTEANSQATTTVSATGKFFVKVAVSHERFRCAIMMTTASAERMLKVKVASSYPKKVRTRLGEGEVSVFEAGMVDVIGSHKVTLGPKYGEKGAG